MGAGRLGYRLPSPSCAVGIRSAYSGAGTTGPGDWGPLDCVLSTEYRIQSGTCPVNNGHSRSWGVGLTVAAKPIRLLPLRGHIKPATRRCQVGVDPTDLLGTPSVKPAKPLRSPPPARRRLRMVLSYQPSRSGSRNSVHFAASPHRPTQRMIPDGPARRCVQARSPKQGTVVLDSCLHQRDGYRSLLGKSYSRSACHQTHPRASTSRLLKEEMLCRANKYRRIHVRHRA